jgi:hypothetical protein
VWRLLNFEAVERGFIYETGEAIQVVKDTGDCLFNFAYNLYGNCFGKVDFLQTLRSMLEVDFNLSIHARIF